MTRGVGPAGPFRVYLGAAPGTGKTVAMLGEGQRRRDRGADVVVAFVESHGRPVTERRMAGLEVVPCLAVEYHGSTFREMDTDGVLRRRPQVALVDELAHTKVPGSGRNGKRWEDILELLDAGIEVITTVNIQHLDSVADTVEQLTGAPVRERVPDWVVRRADQIELSDSSPEQLRRRMLHGNIYPAEQVPRALTQFFRADNLAALRELALRFVADQTGTELSAHLARRHLQGSERILASVIPVPGGDAVVRRAAQMAASVDADLDVVHVAGRDNGGGQDLARLRQVASDVGASWHQLHDEDLVDALIEFARSKQVTQIVVGASRRSRWQELISGGSVVQRVSRRAAKAGIDVHIVAPHEATVP
jgi:two-component system, OmpR family, sensor histidine kinase KdpD